MCKNIQNEFFTLNKQKRDFFLLFMHLNISKKILTMC